MLTVLLAKCLQVHSVMASLMIHSAALVNQIAAGLQSAADSACAVSVTEQKVCRPAPLAQAAHQILSLKRVVNCAH